MQHVVAAKVKQRREDCVRDVISAKAKQRLAKHVKYVTLAHTKRSLEKLVKHLLFPAQKKGYGMFFIGTYHKMQWFAQRQAKARKVYTLFAFRESGAEARNDCKKYAFRTTKGTFLRAVSSVSWEN